MCVYVCVCVCVCIYFLSNDISMIFSVLQKKYIYGGRYVEDTNSKWFNISGTQILRIWQ